ncbi:MAG: hypothetical protein ABI333_05445 [bacterium]
MTILVLLWSVGLGCGRDELDPELEIGLMVVVQLTRVDEHLAGTIHELEFHLGVSETGTDGPFIRTKRSPAGAKTCRAAT